MSFGLFGEICRGVTPIPKEKPSRRSTSKEAMVNTNNNNLQFETLNPSTFAFPRHRRRRPLKSQTYDTFIRILSLCGDASFGFHHPQDDRGGGKVGQVHDVLIANGSKEDLDLSDSRVKVGGFDSMAVSREGNEEFAQENNNVNGLHSMVAGSKVVEIANDQKDSHIKAHNQVFEIVNDQNDKHDKACDQVVEIVNDRNNEHCMVDVCDVEGNNRIRKLKGDEEIHVREVCESIEMPLDMDTVPELTRSGEDCQKKGDVEDSNVSKEMEQELHRRERELEKLISRSVDMDFSQCVPAEEEIEEGEVSGEDGVYHRSVDVLLDDEMLPEDNNVEELQVCKDINYNEKAASEDGNCRTSTSLFQDIISRSDIMIGKENERIGEDVGHNFDYVASRKDAEIWKADSHDSFLLDAGGIMKQVGGPSVSDHPEADLEHTAPGGKVNPQNVARIQVSETVGQEANASKKKKKRGPLTQERKARKKRKDRMKRAEKNRKLGVKRLKLQPVVKLKPVTYCRHYLKGRCQEGEKCKFSHDTIPLTKSKPCCHFARHSCMKGDDCPFDHQLSKYLCDNYVMKGFCSRGASCLFSHKMPTNEGSITTSTGLESGLKSPSMLSDSKKLENIHHIAQQIADTKSCSIGVSVGKSTEHNVGGHVQKHITQAPRGVNIFFRGKSSPIENGNQNQSGQPSTSEKSTKLGHEKIQSGEDNSKKVKDSFERASATWMPKGINFLSFGKTSLNDSSGKAVSSLFPNWDSGIGSSAVSDLSRSKESTSSPKRDDAVKVNNLCGQIEPVLPSAAPRGINFLLLGKASPGHSTAAQSSNSHSNEGNCALNYAHERDGAQLKFQHTSRMPYGLMSSAYPDKSTAENNIGVVSSSKTSFLSNTPSSGQKALRSTLSFAAKFESEIKLEPFISSRPSVVNHTKKTEGSGNKSVKGLTVLDFLYGDSCNTKT